MQYQFVTGALFGVHVCPKAPTQVSNDPQSKSRTDLRDDFNLKGSVTGTISNSILENKLGYFPAFAVPKKV